MFLVNKDVYIMTTNVILPQLKTEVQATSSLYSAVVAYLLIRGYRGESLRLVLLY